MEIESLPIVWTAPAGNRIRIDISSSDFPEFSNHTNTVGNWAEQTETKIANQTIYIDNDNALAGEEATDYLYELGHRRIAYFGVSNAMLAALLEYGKHGQPAKPFLKPAKSASRSACKTAMQQKFEEEVRKI